MARATTTPIVISAHSPCSIISNFIVGLMGIVSVGLKAVEFVNET